VIARTSTSTEDAALFAESASRNKKAIAKRYFDLRLLRDWSALRARRHALTRFHDTSPFRRTLYALLALSAFATGPMDQRETGGTRGVDGSRFFLLLQMPLVRSRCD
jgi:hypothetical protein